MKETKFRMLKLGVGYFNDLKMGSIFNLFSRVL